MKLLLTGGRIIDPSQNLDAEMDLLIENGKIATIGKNIRTPDTASRRASTGEITVIDLRGMFVVPGLIDMHTHLREPGFEYRETIQTGGVAATAGGFTSVACMPNTKPVNDTRSVTEYIKRKAATCNLVNVYPIAAISVGSEGSTMTEFRDLQDAGAVAFSDDGKPVTDSALMRRALEYASSLDMPIISHCEDLQLSAGGSMNEGFVSTELGLQGIPTIAEETIVARDIIIADYTKTILHIAHVSTAGAVRIIRDAKERGVRVTAETAPHYYTLTDETLREFDTSTKVNPPLRTVEDINALKEGLRDGTIDVIASDHAPHASTDKEVEFEYAASGITGLETSLALSMKLVDDGTLTMRDLILKMSINPAAILKIPKGNLKIGSDADITVIDPGKKWTVNRDSMRSKGKNTPFHGWCLKGKAILTVVGGEIKYRESL
ncbi:MAG TPA: dihydroorotase [Syntrophaceae bacterium]|jgi:dihydroorotase|nr:dihydroorotase [Syntrophaceae bacterium]